MRLRPIPIIRYRYFKVVNKVWLKNFGSNDKQFGIAAAHFGETAPFEFKLWSIYQVPTQLRSNRHKGSKFVYLSFSLV